MTAKVEFTEKDMEQIETMAGLGMPLHHIAAVIGVGKATIERHAKTNPALTEALEKGRGKAAHEIYKTAYELAKSGKVPAMTMFWLKCQAGWKEGQGALDEELKKFIQVTTENVAKLYEVARNSSQGSANKPAA